MKLIADDIGVDAGLIMVACHSYLEDMECNESDLMELKRLGKTFDIPNGKYQVKWNIKKSWNGNIKGEEEINVTSGQIFVTDPCYVFQNDNQTRWTKWLEDNDSGDKVNSDKGFVINKMGGDGLYKVNLDFIKAD